MKPLVAALGALVLVASHAQSPFAPPRASLHYAPDRTCDLLDLTLDVEVDYANRAIAGTVVNTMSPLRNGITDVMLHAGEGLVFSRVTVDGASAKYTRNGRELHITTSPLTKGKPIKIAISYSAKNSRGRAFGAGGGGWHWIQGTGREGFWTQGESGYNSEWCPTWDYPNDMTTSETRCTVQAGWDVVGNGKLVATSTSADGKKKTFDWKMTQPHATYLLSLCGGPFDIKRENWEGVQLWYVVPKGEAYIIDSSFGHTKDMLSFYSKVLGVKYAWPKYAQNAMFDFGGGMENVSATTLGEGSLTESRDGYYNMDSLNSHELGHQWFGDLVTCKDWGDTWLNESFATFMESIYFEHSRGADAYAWEIDGNMRSYFAEARRYKRPLSTKMYPNADAMFDQHTYPKGGVILHTLRRMLGDENFYAGLNYYLTKWRHTPVESAQLRRAFTEATGINVEPFWAQWIDKPGHPVLDYTWAWQPDAQGESGKVMLTVKQTQDTANGTPIYDIPAHVGFASDGAFQMPVHITKAEETFELPLPAKPHAVLLDPNHDFLRETPTLHWAAEELPFIVRYAPNAVDRTEALRQLMDTPSDATIRLATEVFAKDDGVSPAFRQVTSLANLAKPELRPFWLAQLSHKNVDRQSAAVRALAQLPQDPETTKRLRALINDKSPITVVINAITALADWDAKGNADVFKAAALIKDRRGRIKRAAESALGN